MFPSGSATMAMMPKPCWVGSATNFTPALVQPLAVIEQVFDVEGDAGVAAHEGQRVGVHGRVHAEAGFAVEELGAEGALAEERQAEVVAVEQQRPVEVGHEHGDAVEVGHRRPIPRDCECATRRRSNWAFPSIRMMNWRLTVLIIRTAPDMPSRADCWAT